MTKEKKSLVLVYTGDGKGKTSAAIGTLVRALGAGQRVAFIQFIKSWEVSEHKFLKKIQPLFDDKLTFYVGGKGFYHAGDQSAKGVSDDDHVVAAHQTLDFALEIVKSTKYDLVILDEINNTVADGLLTIDDLRKLIADRAEITSLCLTGRNFPKELKNLADIITEMKEVEHHFRDGFPAKEGIDY
ncbi:MAG: cob(I)yrinic acid a,c-diamide adenosyltransferase [Candidatus Nomurabacteria bacterium]|jgi:cob(I)alamin adenosyltransferase|nr:cob(I)yrinic acid a,c-diamide adenosyltransferase [Candidatus Nomurabacteria bacterium]